MKIGTWNIERLKHQKDIQSIYANLTKCDADILVLTETDNRVAPAYPFCDSTPTPINGSPVYYSNTENRVSIFSKYKIIETYPTYDEYTSLCVEVITDMGNLVVYGTIMGILGNTDTNFKTDVAKQMEDIRNLISSGKSVCVIGDYNLSFGDNYYFTTIGRELVKNTFSECGVLILTNDMLECVDHIAVSQKFIGNREVAIYEWNLDKKLSDHKGIMVDIK